LHRTPGLPARISFSKAGAGKAPERKPGARAAFFLMLFYHSYIALESQDDFEFFDAQSCNIVNKT
jgi:hypothetical protein